MKKLILFLLLPLWAMAQTSTGQEQEFDYGIKNNSTQTITTPTYLTTTGMDGTQGKIPSALIEKTDNKQNSLAVDGTGTKYPTVDAVNAVIVNETTGVFSNIQTLVNSAPSGSTINLKPNTIYAQDNSLVLKEGITINGNGATLKRNAQQTTTTTVSSTEVSTSLTVSSVPVGWKTGDYLQLYTDETVFTSSRKYEVIIQSIAGNTITLSQPIGAHASGSTYTWAIGTTVRKVFSQITSARSYDLFTVPTNWTVNNLIIDGNYTQNAGNFYWGVNMAVQNNGRGELHNVTFKDIPNECVFGSGFTIKNSTLTNSNGSFLHQSADVTVGNSIFGGEITGNTTKNTNIKDGVNVMGHSEALITFSFSSGRTKISNNRFLGGSAAVMGRVENSYTSIDGSLKDFIFTNNYCESFTSIFDRFAYSASGLVTNVDNVLISNNTFNNCGVNDFGSYSSQINSFGKIKIYDNILNGTTTILNSPWKLSFNESIQKISTALGTTVTPYYDKTASGGNQGVSESSLSFGNSFGSNNGTYFKLSVNSPSAPNTPIDVVTGTPEGKVIFAGSTESNGGFIAVSSNVNSLNTSYTIANSVAAKTVAFTAGKSGVSQDGFGFHNVTDNTYPVWVEPSGDVSLNANTTVSGTVKATNYTGSATLTGTPTAPTAAYGTTGNQIATVDYVQGAKSITVRKISTNTTLADSDNGKVILITSSCTITLPNGLMSGFNVSFATQVGATLTYSLGGSVVLINNAGTTMGELSSHTIVNTGTSNEYLTVGL